MSSQINNYRLDKWLSFLWGLVILTLPVTTFRYFPSIFGATQIKPMALIPLAFLFPLLLVRAWRQRIIYWPENMIPLLIFILILIATTLFGSLLAPIELRGQTFWTRSLRAWISLAVGLVFFFSAVWMHRTAQDIKRSVRWLFIALLLTFLLGGLQIVAINTSLLEKDAIDGLQLILSDHPLILNRISGFAYEPAWLADQIVIYYFPWLIAGLITGFRVVRIRGIELGLLVLGAILLLFSFSRGGIFSAVLVSIVVLLLTGREYLQRIWDWFRSPFRPTGYYVGEEKFPPKVVRVGLVFLVVAGLFASLYVISQSRYVSTLWTRNFDRGVLNYLIRNSAGPRLAYSVAGFEIFSLHVWTGVGFGGSGLYIFDQLPDWVLATGFEIARGLSPDSFVIFNIKNLYIRLLAESGLLGFWAFIALYFSILGSIRKLYISNQPFLRYVAIAGMFVWMAAGFRNFTQDSLTFPLMWVSLGMVLGYTSAPVKFGLSKEIISKPLDS